ncbi:TetR family transcriptional regulator [Nocardia sp. ET3-3]|uniref:TetR family transcriptional regulator n=1 Tax=Nocardia terrae TaxID=2675851 RepID=A0A7K1V6U0_9NOCA|nr:TetR/AcrR family transcriptional regulator [Nocardia terrae]MVU82350.1 TetR family transcriptional regulator [Nocardia terrae]
MNKQQPQHIPIDSTNPHSIPRGLRADARRNRQAVLHAAQQLFAREGLSVPLDEIARQAGVGPGTVHRHFPTKEALYLAVSIDQLETLVAEAAALADGDDPAAVFTLLARMMANGAENSAVKSALAAAEFDLRIVAPEVATALTGHVSDLLNRARTAGLVRDDITVEEVMALVAGAFTAIHHANTQTDPGRATHIAGIILDGLRPRY